MHFNKKLAARILAGLMIASAMAVPAMAVSGTVNSGDTTLNLREGASAESKVLADLQNGSKVEVLATAEDGWYQIAVDGLTGFAFGEYLILDGAENAVTAAASSSPVEAAAAAEEVAQAAESAVQATRYGQVIASSLYIRTGAGTNYDKAGSLKNGAIVTITGETNGWYKISSGYVSSDYVSIVDEATAKAAQAAAANTTSGQKMAEFALKYVGYPYVYGGSSPKGFDCSGFVKYVCNQFGYNVNRTASAQMDNGTSVSRDQLQPGDLVFFRKSGSSSRASHVGIYVGGGKFVHASTSKVGVIVSGLNEAYYTSGFVGARRLG